MSWGERSCLACNAPNDYCEYGTCNVDCPWYKWDGKTKPDSIKSSEAQLKRIRDEEMRRKKEINQQKCCGINLELKQKNGKYFFYCQKCRKKYKTR